MEWFAEYLTLFGDRHSERRTLLDSLQPSRREPLAALFGFMPGRGLLFPKTLMTSPWSDRCHSLPTSLPLNPASLPLFRASLPFLPASLPFFAGTVADFLGTVADFSGTVAGFSGIVSEFSGHSLLPGNAGIEARILVPTLLGPHKCLQHRACWILPYCARAVQHGHGRSAHGPA